MGIRDAVTSDLPQLMQWAESMWSESRYARLSFSHTKMSHLFSTLIESPIGIVLMTGHGMIVGFVDEYWFGHDCYAFEYGVFVEPDHRGTDGVRLIKAYIERAKAFGARDIHIENTTGVETDRTERLFHNLGFAHVGGNFILEVN